MKKKIDEELAWDWDAASGRVHLQRHGYTMVATVLGLLGPSCRPGRLEERERERGRKDEGGRAQIIARLKTTTR
jgi:hypothetical protein